MTSTFSPRGIKYLTPGLRWHGNRCSSDLFADVVAKHSRNDKYNSIQVELSAVLF